MLRELNCLPSGAWGTASHALLIIHGGKYSVVLVDQPAGFTQLEYRKEYPLRTFLKRLAKE